MVDAQESAAEAVGGSSCSEVGVIIGVEFTFRMEPNLVEHSREIKHAVDFFVSAFRPRVHSGKLSAKTHFRQGSGSFPQYGIASTFLDSRTEILLTIPACLRTVRKNHALRVYRKIGNRD